MKSETYVIILAAGYATRLRPISNRIPKPLIDIGGKTIISRVISNFREAGFTKFCVIVGYMRGLIKNELLKQKDLDLLIIDQDKPTGMADAIHLAMNFISQKDKTITNFFISAADIIISNENILKMYKLYTHSDVVLGLMKSNDHNIAKGHGNVKISEKSALKGDLDFSQEFRIIDIIEKPQIHQILSEYYSLPLYLVNREILSSMNQLEVSERGEKEFQDVLKRVISNGMNVQGVLIVDPFITIDTVGAFHLTNLKDILIMNKRFLSGACKNQIDGKSYKIIEPVRIESSVIIENDVLIGPYATIGKFCKIGKYCELTNVILYDNVILGKYSKLNCCIIDENVELSENFHAKECFITTNNKKEIDVINF